MTTFDDILKSYVGEFGRYQKIQFLLVVYFAVIFEHLRESSSKFTDAEIEHRCLYPGEPADPPPQFKPEPGSWLYKAMQLVGNDSYDRGCLRVAGINASTVDFPNSTQVKLEYCDEYVWNNNGPIMLESTRKRLGLVCNRAWIHPLFIELAYAAGLIFGALMLPLADKIGRKPVFYTAIIILTVGGTAMAYIPWWPVLSLVRLCVGLASPFICVIAVVIGMEIVGINRRMLSGVLGGISVNLAGIISGALAYGITDDRYYQLAISLPGVLLIVSYWWFVPESARWLVTQHRFAEADALLQRAAKMNKRPALPSNWHEQIDNQVSTAESRKGGCCGGVCQTYNLLFRTPNLRKRSRLLSCVCWPAFSMISQGLVNPYPQLLSGGDDRMELIVSSLMAISVLILVMVTINIVGRKFLCLTGYSIAALVFIVWIIVALTDSDELSGYEFALMVIVIIGKSAVTGLNAVLVIWTLEMFPTTVRVAAIAVCDILSGVIATAFKIVMRFPARLLHKSVPHAICAMAALLAIAACLALPETAGRPTLETISEAEQFGKDIPMFKFSKKNRSSGSAEEQQQKTQEESLIDAPTAKTNVE